MQSDQKKKNGVTMETGMEKYGKGGKRGFAKRQKEILDSIIPSMK